MTNENRTITIIVAPNGKTKIETHGYNGPACQSASKFIEDALGKRTAERLTAPYFLNETNHTHLEIKQ